MLKYLDTVGNRITLFYYKQRRLSFRLHRIDGRKVPDPCLTLSHRISFCCSVVSRHRSGPRSLGYSGLSLQVQM